MFNVTISSPVNMVEATCDKLSFISCNGAITLLSNHAPLLTLAEARSSVTIGDKTYQLNDDATVQFENNKCLITVSSFSIINS